MWCVELAICMSDLVMVTLRKTGIHFNKYGHCRSQILLLRKTNFGTRSVIVLLLLTVGVTITHHHYRALKGAAASGNMLPSVVYNNPGGDVCAVWFATLSKFLTTIILEN